MHRSCVVPVHSTSPPPTPLPSPQVLPLLITCLNAMDWALRSSFFKAVSCIGAFTGHESLDVFLLPCLEQVRGAYAWQWHSWEEGAGGCKTRETAGNSGVGQDKSAGKGWGGQGLHHSRGVLHGWEGRDKEAMAGERQSGEGH